MALWRGKLGLIALKIRGKKTLETEQHMLRGVVTDCQALGWVEVDGVRVLAIEMEVGAPHGPSRPVVLGLTPEAMEELQHQLSLASALGTGTAGPLVQ